jgi:hypothetical protein
MVQLGVQRAFIQTVGSDPLMTIYYDVAKEVKKMWAIFCP